MHDLKDAADVLDVCQAHGHDEVDTARVYGGGSSEEYLAQLQWQSRGIEVSTKIPPSSSASNYGHHPNKLRSGLLTSLEALEADKVDIWYLHAPDHSVPYEDTFREINNLYKEGHFKRLGVSNFSAWEVARISEIIIREGWKKIDVYQGVYNALQRSVEPELFPALRHYGIAFYQYNPLAGGFLTDRYQREAGSIEEGARFDPKRSQGVMYRSRYWNDTYFSALDKVRPVAKKLGLTTAEAALRWSSHHSLLSREAGDAIIIGASSAKQLETNLADLEKGPLPEELVNALDEGWATAKVLAKPYFY